MAGDPVEAVQDARKAAAGTKLWTISHAYRLRTGKESLISVLLHELSHQVHYWAGAPQKPPGVGSLTKYGETNHLEWHAEHLAAWLINRDALHAWSPAAAEHLDNMMERAITSAGKSR